jgi:outer membrane protein
LLQYHFWCYAKQQCTKQRLPHVDVSEIMAKMPAMLDAQKQLEKLNGRYG